MAVTDEQIARVAKLARLRLTPELQAQMGRKVNAMLEMLDVLNGIDVSAVEPLFHPADVALVLRPDRAKPNAHLAEFQSLAPETSGDMYLVPKVIESV